MGWSFPGRPAALRAAGRIHLGRTSEEAQLVLAVADQQVLGLLVVVQHHLVGLAADARFLVAAEGRVRRVGVVAVGPHAPGLDGRSEEHTSESSHQIISYAVFCLKKKKSVT